MKKTIIFSVKGRADLLFSVTSLSVEFRKNGYKTILISEKCDVDYIKNEFDERYFLPKLNSTLNCFLFVPYVFFYTFFLSFKGNILISYEGKISVFLKLFFYLFKKPFFIIKFQSYIRKVDEFLLYKAKNIFYIFSKTKFKKKVDKCCLIGPPLPSKYKFSYIKHNSENFIISLFIDIKNTRECLSKLSEILPDKIKNKLIINICNESEYLCNDILKFKKINLKKEYDIFDIILKSHLILCNARGVMLGRISSIGRPVFLFCNGKNEILNAISYSQLNEGCYGDLNLLASFIEKLVENEMFFYEKCKDSSLSMLENGRLDVFEKINFLFDK